MARVSMVIPLFFAGLYLLAYGLERGLYVGKTDRIDVSTLLRRDCHYMKWDGIRTIISEDKDNCRWFVEEFDWH